MEMMMEVIINFSRPGKGLSRYIEGLVDDDPVRMKTLNHVPLEISAKWCEEVWWQNGCIPHGILIGSVMKYLFYREWFSVMKLLESDGNHLGYYVDVDSPIRKSRGEFYLTDLFLDLWIAPDSKIIELDRDEFEEGFRMGLLTPYQHKKANQVLDRLKRSVTNGEFFRILY
jgi:hypothetical protein